MTVTRRVYFWEGEGGIWYSLLEILLQRPSFFLSPFRFWLQSLAEEGVSSCIVTAHIFVKHHDIYKM
jgi:hypothetical protein